MDERLLDEIGVRHPEKDKPEPKQKPIREFTFRHYEGDF